MSRRKSFDRELDGLWHRRTAALRRLVHPRRGTPAALTRQQRERGIDRLTRLAEEMRPRTLARGELARMAQERRTHRLRGPGRSSRREDRFWDLIRWAEERIGRRAFVYAFYRRQQCLYVGKASDHRRLRAYLRDIAFHRATKVVCLLTSRAHLDRLECIAMHLFRPLHNRARARRQGRRHCPVCRATSEIRAELRRIFAG